MFKFNHVTEIDICRKLSSLNTRKASGYDQQPPRLLKLNAPILSYALLPIINNAFEYNVFPSDLKHAEVSPLFKKDDKMNEEKYRPVSVLVCQSKVFESLMLDQLMEYIQGKLSDILSAYRKECNTQHVLMHAIEEWKTALDRGQHVGVVMMDVSKAFDAIPHGLLLSKLHSYGLSKNASKFQALCVSKAVNPPLLELFIDGIIVRSEPRVKLFGIHIDQRLKFTYHITEMCKKANSQARALARLSSMLDTESKFLIFNAFVVSNFLYCRLVWHMCCVSDCKKIEKVQERALRYVLNDFNNTYSILLHIASKSTLYLARLRILAIEIKCHL